MLSSAAMGTAHSLVSLGRRVVDTVLPPRCLGCGAVVGEAGAICAECWRGLDFIAPPFCDRCGLPFAYDTGPGALCGACAADPPLYGRARAVLTYNDGGRSLILAFKHADRTDAAPAYGKWLARAGADLLADAGLIVPVPLHRGRLLARRYNQAALLSQALGRAARREVAVDALVRTRATPSQGRMSRLQRARNVQGAFEVRACRRAAVADRRIVLVDDVMTTGATVAGCVRALRRAGAAEVDVLTLARVTRTG